MYLHVGNGLCLNDDDIIAIFDIDSIKDTKEYENFYNKFLEEKKIIDFSKGNGKSLILVDKNGNKKIYISNISANTIGRRN